MNSITTKNQRNGLDLAEPDISTSLAGLLGDFIPLYGELIVTRERDKLEAQTILPSLQRLCGPTTIKAIEDWLTLIASSVKNPPSDGDFAARVVLIGTVMGDLPIGVWTRETQARAARTFKFWPSVAELDELLRPVGDNLRSKLRKAARIAEGTVHRPLRPVTPEQEAEYIRTVAVARQATRQAQQAAAPRLDEPLEVPSREVMIQRYESILRLSAHEPSRAVARDMLMRLRAPIPASPAETSESKGPDGQTVPQIGRLTPASLAASPAAAEDPAAFDRPASTAGEPA